MRMINIGEQSFKELIINNDLYVDKTLFIKEWYENRDSVTIITQPRRFGKTLTMDMMNEFFSIDHKDSHLFDNLDIYKYEKYKNIQGTYPVIYLSFSSIKGSHYQSTIDLIKQKIINIYNRFDYLLESGLLKDNEINQFKYINMNMSEEMMMQSLNQLSIYLERYYNKKVIILLDEYDTPIVEAYTNDYYHKMMSFMRNFFNASFKDNHSMYRSVLTGITRVSKESLFSDFNNIIVCEFTSTTMYDNYFGFTEEEVFDL